MEKNHITDLLPDYVDDLLNESEKKKVDAHLTVCDSCSQELEEFKMLFNAFKNEEETNPSQNLNISFLEQLELEKQNNSNVISMDTSSIERKNNWSNNFLKIAASLALLVGTYFFGKQQQTQISNTKIAQLNNESLAYKQTAMLSLMENKSASRRIQGVNYIEEFKEPDEAIVQALADRMLHDENTNVRAAAVEVLSNYTKSERVKETFIEALSIEKDPGIQVMIIQTLGEIQEKKAAFPMRKLLGEEGTQPFVKEQIKSVLNTII